MLRGFINKNKLSIKHALAVYKLIHIKRVAGKKRAFNAKIKI